MGDPHPYRLKSQGYRFDFNRSHKYWTITPPRGKKPVRLYRLGEEYGRCRIEERIWENRDKVIPQPFQRAQPKQYLLDMPNDLLKNHSSLYRKYLYYCYRLGIFPKRPEKQAPLSAETLEALGNLAKLSRSVDLMAREHIETDEDFSVYRSKAETATEDLSRQRAELRNEIRRRRVPEERIAEAKQEISSLSEQIALLRKDIKTCDFIAERSKAVDEHIRDMDERPRQKKERSYER